MSDIEFPNLGFKFSVPSLNLSDAVLDSLHDYNEIARGVEVSSVEPVSYEDSILKQQADDIASQVSAKIDRQVEAIESIAESASISASAAEQTAKNADIKGWVAIFISALALIWSIISFFI